MEWRAKKHDLPPKLFDGMRASYPGVRRKRERLGEGGEEGRKGESVAIVFDVIHVPWYCLPSSTGAVTGQFFRLRSLCSSVRGESPQGQLNYHLTKPRSASVERRHSFSSPSLSICCRVSKRTGPSPPPQTLGPVIRRRTASGQLLRV